MHVSVREATSSKKQRTVESNSPHPYNFSKGEDSSYYFETEKGLKYSAYFIEFPATIHKLYSFSFEKEEGSGAHDARVRDTIMCILQDFFKNENYILGYTCDVSDGREMARKRLFNRWFEEANDGTLKKFDFQTDNIFVSLILNKNYFAIDQAVNDINELFVAVLAQK